MSFACPAAKHGRDVTAVIASALSVLLTFTSATPTHAQRVKGLDTSSAANGSAPSQALWNTAFSQGYQFAFVRSSRGGTSDATRLDDSQFYDNITRATNAGMLTGSYHFARPDVVTHTATDDANHYLERAGMYMKPGYLLPVFDLEDGNVEHSQASLSAWSNEFINTIFNAKGINPIVYTSSSYNNDEVNASVAFNNFGATPKTDPKTYQWVARPGSNGLTGNPPPANNYPNPYGAWDPNFVTRTNSREPAIKPWVFWQQTLDTTPAGLFKIDIDYANGNIEFVKDFLVPALWTNAGSGDWGTTSNWNSDNPTYNGTIQSGPAPRLPNNASLDWVKLQNPSDGAVTISSGARNVRKLYTQQPLNITGGSLNVSYIPGSGGKWDLPSEFNDFVTLGVGAAYSAHTTQINGGGGQFNLNGGAVTFKELQLASHATIPGIITMGGEVTFVASAGPGPAVIRSLGSLAQPGHIELDGGEQTFAVNDAVSGVDLDVRVPVTGTGRLRKTGAGTMNLAVANSYTGGTRVSSGGVLQIAADDRLGAVPVGLDSDNIIVDGGRLRTGAQITSVSLTNAGSGYTSFPSLTIGGAGSDVYPASANVLAGISSIAVTNGGSGYVNQTPSSPPAFNTSATYVDIIGGGGTGATAYATVVGGTVTGITIANPGTGYTSMPTIFISSAVSSGFAGSGATANVSGITLQGIALNHGGFDYTSPTITLTGGGGTGATASATSNPNITLDSDRGVLFTDLADAGALEQTAGTTLTINSAISSTANGILVKDGDGTLVLTGANTHTGGTIVAGGNLVVSGALATLGTGSITVQGPTAATSLTIESGVANAIDDNAIVYLFAGGVPDIADQGYMELGTGITEVVDTLYLGGIAQLNGTYGSSLSNATFKLDDYFSGTGILQVGSLPPIFPGDYNDDGIVDASDYIVWKKNVGQPAGTLPNDDTGMPIGDDQYNLWQTNFGNTEAGSGSAVPELTTIALLLIALAPLAARRQRHD
jgi:autotransporter-associated beta strand protein